LKARKVKMESSQST